ncbi:hypothetical protein ACJWDR_16685 [Streptomyces tauricus]|uniref:hypothetical protein n=1 Tax=Streptomyces tauricus TaxID=68274 RepID=UPI00387EE93A
MSRWSAALPGRRGGSGTGRRTRGPAVGPSGGNGSRAAESRGAGGALPVEEIDGVLLVRSVEDDSFPLAALEEVAHALGADEGVVTVMVGSAGAGGTPDADLWARLGALLDSLRAKGTRRVRLVMSGAGDESPGRPCVARRIADAWQLEVIAPDGAVLITPGGTLFVHEGNGGQRGGRGGHGGSARGRGWWSFGPGEAPRALGPRAPEPVWQEALGGVPSRTAGGCVVDRIPAGVVMRPAEAPGPGLDDLCFAMPVDFERLTVLVGAPQAEDVAADEVAAVLAALPVAQRSRARLAPGGRRDLLWLGQSVSDLLGSEVEVLTGLPLLDDHAPPGTAPRPTLVGTDGKPGWRPFVSSVACRPADAEGRVFAPRLVESRPPAWIPGGSGPGAVRLTDRWQATVTRAGLALWEQDGPRPPLAGTPVDPDTCTIELGLPGQLLDDSLLPALSRLLVGLEAGTRAKATLLVRGRLTSGESELRRLAAEHGVASIRYVTARKTPGPGSTPRTQIPAPPDRPSTTPPPVRVSSGTQQTAIPTPLTAAPTGAPPSPRRATTTTTAPDAPTALDHADPDTSKAPAEPGSGPDLGPGSGPGSGPRPGPGSDLGLGVGLGSGSGLGPEPRLGSDPGPNPGPGAGLEAGPGSVAGGLAGASSAVYASDGAAGSAPEGSGAAEEPEPGPDLGLGPGSGSGVGLTPGPGPGPVLAAGALAGASAVYASGGATGRAPERFGAAEGPDPGPGSAASPDLGPASGPGPGSTPGPGPGPGPVAGARAGTSSAVYASGGAASGESDGSRSADEPGPGPGPDLGPRPDPTPGPGPGLGPAAGALAGASPSARVGGGGPEGGGPAEQELPVVGVARGAGPTVPTAGAGTGASSMAYVSSGAHDGGEPERSGGGHGTGPAPEPEPDGVGRGAQEHGSRGAESGAEGAGREAQEHASRGPAPEAEGGGPVRRGDQEQRPRGAEHPSAPVSSVRSGSGEGGPGPRFPASGAQPLPLSPGHVSGAAERAAFREFAGGAWERHAAVVSRVLTRMPALRGRELDAARTDLIAAHAYLTTEEGPLHHDELIRDMRSGEERLLPYAGCLASALRRLPSYRGLALRAGGVDGPEPVVGSLIQEPGPLSALAATSSELPSADSVPSVRYAIWSVTGRKVRQLLERPAGPAYDEIVFVPGTGFRVLGVRAAGAEGTAARSSVVLLREIPGNAIAYMDGAEELSSLDLKALAQLEEALGKGLPAGEGPRWPERCTGPVGRDGQA